MEILMILSGFGRRKNKHNSKPNLGKGKSKKAKGKMRPI
jgi:hypothetical protein